MDPIILIGPLVGGFVTLLLWTQSRTNTKLEKGFDKIELGFGGIGKELRQVSDKIERVDNKVTDLRDEVHDKYVSKTLLGFILDEQDRRTDRKMFERGWEIRNVGPLSSGRDNIQRLDTRDPNKSKLWDDVIDDLGKDNNIR